MSNDLVIAASLVDLERVTEWMDRTGLGEGPVVARELIAGGTQNFLVRIERAGREYVLRRPPEHKRANSDDTMRREARVLAALAGSDVPHPALVAACTDTAVIGAAFYLMEPVEGFNATLGLPAEVITCRISRPLSSSQMAGLLLSTVPLRRSEDAELKATIGV